MVQGEILKLLLIQERGRKGVYIYVENGQKAADGLREGEEGAGMESWRYEGKKW